MSVLKSIKVAEHSLVSCESLLFIGVLFKTRAGIKLKFGTDKNIFTRHCVY